jgi:hypothetical protein
MPFLKGQSGNVSGRPRGANSVRKTAQAHAGEAISVMLTVMRDAAIPPDSRIFAARSIVELATTTNTKNLSHEHFDGLVRCAT